MATMTPRERVLAALNHQEPDRVPVDIGGGRATSIVVEGYERLKSLLGVSGETHLLSLWTRVARLDEEVLRILGSDCRPLIGRGLPASRRRKRRPDQAVDEWGVTRQRTFYADAAYYWEVVAHPLAEATIDDLERYPWPDPLDPAYTAGLAEEARTLFENTDYALVGDSGFQSHWEAAFYLRGFEQLLLDLADDPEFVHALLAKILEINIKATSRFLDAVGRYVQVVHTSDDLATQRGPLMSPELYRRIVKPYFREYVRFLKSRTDAKVFYHSCGNITDFIDDLVDCGVDVINPVQVAAMGDTSVLKSRFGHKVSFWGGIDTQHVLPHGSVEEVEAEVRQRISDLAPGGGYVVAAVHNIQPDVPAANIVAMMKTIRAVGRYPSPGEDPLHHGAPGG